MSYLHRLTVLFGIAELAPEVSLDLAKAKFMPVLQTMHKDPIANVRINVAKTVMALQSHIK